MTHQPQAIEVEVVEIDGATPPARPKSHPEIPLPAQGWQSRVRSLDRRWWPLWLFLGIIAAVLVLTLGLVIGIIFLVLRAIYRIIDALTR